MNDDRREREENARLEALFRADPGPASSELAEARLMLKRALAREQSGRAADAGSVDRAAASSPRATILQLVSRRSLWIASQAAGFALLFALLVPVLPRVLPADASPRAGVDLVASLADEARSVRARIRPWIPSLPSLPPLSLPASMSTEMRSSPASGLFDWISSLHSEAR